MVASTSSEPSIDRYQVTAQQYIAFRRDGFLVVPQLVSADDVTQLRQHTDDLMQGRLPEQQQTRMLERDLSKDAAVTIQNLEAPPEHLSPEEKAQIREKAKERFQQLSPEERREIREKMREVKERGSVEERKQFRERLREKLQQRNEKD